MRGMCLVSCAMSGVVLTSTPAPGQERLAITGVTVVDVAGGTQRESQTVLVEGNRITAVGRTDEISVPDGAPEVSGAGGYLIPGLWDMHVHLASGGTVPPLRLFAAFGVTSVRDVGGSLAHLRMARRQGLTTDSLAPRLFFCGAELDGDPPASPWTSIIVATPLEAANAIEFLASQGADCIKAYERIELDTFERIVNESSARQLPVVVHPSADVTMRVAARLGARSIEHLHLGKGDIEGVALSDTQQQRPLWDRQTLLWTQFDPMSNAARALIDILERHDTYLTPTLTIDEGNLLLSDSAQALDPQNAMLPETVLRDWQRQATAQAPNVSPELRLAAVTAAERRSQFVKEASRAGVPLLAGSGGPWLGTYLPGPGLHHELALLVEAGASPIDALRAATLHPARFFAAGDSLGTIEVGKLADLVLLDADPLADITNTRRIRAVIVDGRLYGRADLERIVGGSAASQR